MPLTPNEFDALVTLIERLSYRAAGDAVHQRRAGSSDEDIEDARRELVVDPDDPDNI